MSTLAEDLHVTRWPVLDLAAVLDAPSVPTAAVVVLDEWTPRAALRLSELAWREAVTLLPIRVDGGTVLVGPPLYRGAAACLRCVETERLATIGGHTPRRDADLALGGVVPPTGDPLLTTLVDRALLDRQAHDGVMWAIRSSDGSCSSHRARPRRGGCDVCGPLPDDTADAARFVIHSRLLADPAVLRQPNPRTGTGALRAALHDRRLGPVAHVSRGEGLPLAIAHAEVVADWVERDGGYGRAATFAEAERIAMFEAVERMCGLSPRGKRTTLRASYEELGATRALDPRVLGMHEPASCDHPTFRLTPYTPQVRTTWVHGWSLRSDAAVAVPEQVAYWGHPPAPREDGMAEFMFESSNGCGLGNSAEEACLYGLFEIAERDAFLMAWYTQAALTRVAVPYEDDMVAHLADRLDSLGYDLLLFDTTNDFDIPAVLALALCRDTDSPAPQAFFSAGAHHDPLSAIRSAVVEISVNLVQSTNVARAKPRYFDRDRLRPMADDPDAVTTIDDHIALYTLPEMRDRYRFLLDAPGPARPCSDVWPGRPAQVADLGVLLDHLVHGVVDAGMDVIVVDQSDPVIRAELGLHSMRVIVPGAVPLTFAHVYRRTRGLPRLLDVPFRLGWSTEPLRYEDLHLDPHPFP